MRIYETKNGVLKTKYICDVCTKDVKEPRTYHYCDDCHDVVQHQVNNINERADNEQGSEPTQ